MNIYLKEKIGNPDLFTGRKRELAFFLKWIEGIKKEISMSTAILSRRKTGKTALLQRLYNLSFEQNDGVIPFYYEVRESPVWMGDFCLDFFLTFIYQMWRSTPETPPILNRMLKKVANTRWTSFTRNISNISARQLQEFKNWHKKNEEICSGQW